MIHHDQSSYIRVASAKENTFSKPSAAAAAAGVAVAIQQPPAAPKLDDDSAMMMMMMMIQTKNNKVRDVKAAFASWTKPYWNQTFNNINNNNSFVFPSVHVRLRYYMGSWYNQTLDTTVMNCTAAFKFINQRFFAIMHDQDVLYSYESLTHELRTYQHWNSDHYLRYYHRVLRNSSDLKKAVVAMRTGDSSSIKANVPVVAKTRKAGLDDPTVERDTYFGIIWPLNMMRHFEPIQDYLALEEAGNVTAWNDKKEALIWRGRYTGIPFLMKGEGYRKSFHQYGPRVQAVVANCFHNTSEIDVAFGWMIPKRNGIPTSLLKTMAQNCVRDSHSSMQAQLEYKYILNIEGNDVSSGLKWQLASNSVVFMAKPMTVSWAMEDQLVPFYHYIPVDDNYENLPEMMDWAKTHDDEARKIAVQSTQYMYDLWISQKAQREFAELHTSLATTYESQFGSALSKCLKGVPAVVEKTKKKKKKKKHKVQIKRLPKNWNNHHHHHHRHARSSSIMNKNNNKPSSAKEKMTR